MTPKSPKTSLFLLSVLAVPLAVGLCVVSTGCSGGQDKPTASGNSTYYSGHMASDDEVGPRKQKGMSANGK
jgi:hypothetical protein